MEDKILSKAKSLELGDVLKVAIPGSCLNEKTGEERRGEERRGEERRGEERRGEEKRKVRTDNERGIIKGKCSTFNILKYRCHGQQLPC